MKQRRHTNPTKDLTFDLPFVIQGGCCIKILTGLFSIKADDVFRACCY